MAWSDAIGQVELRYAESMDSGWGDANAVVTPYVTFPEIAVAPYSGNSITAVGNGLMKAASNCYVYIKKNPEDAKYIYRQKLGDLQAGWNVITLDEPYEIKGDENISIGYKASFKEAGGVGVYGVNNPDGDKVYYNSLDRWTSTGGAICVTAVVEGDNMPLNEMSIGKIGDVTASYDADTVEIAAVVKNMGANEVEAYSIGITVDEETVEMSYDRHVAVNGCDTVLFEVPAVEKGKHKVSVNILTVNGVEDIYDFNNSSSATVTVPDKAFARRIVCEEMTGTWCGFCPRGMVGLELMKEKHEGMFIAVSVHSDDPMAIDPESPLSYGEFIASCTGAPSCNVDRRFSGDPYADIQRLYDMERNVENHVAIETEAFWNADGTIGVRSVYFTDIDIENPAYRIAYTLTEDGITGYPQTNYYAGGKNGDMYGWEDKGDPAVDVTYNDVARGIFGGYRGMPLADSPIVAYTRYEHEYEIEVPASVRDKSKIHVIGQIIDSVSNSIQNAYYTEVKGDVPNSSAAEMTTGHEVRTDNGLIVVCGDNLEGATALVADICGRIVAISGLHNGENRISVTGSGVFVLSVNNTKAEKYKVIL